jgi:mono/diheme cytochrome c family protein
LTTSSAALLTARKAAAPRRRQTAPMLLLRHPRWLLCVVAALCACAGAPAAVPPPDEPMPGDYRVRDGRVDRGTYLGWRLFHSACFGCHGVGAVGTAVAPNLVERVRTMTPRDFASKVLTSYRLVSPADEESDAARAATLEEILRRDRRAARGQVQMPVWGGHAEVPPHVLDLYAYLSARAAGDVGAGEPKVMAPRGKR